MTMPSFPTAGEAAELPVDELALRLLRHLSADASLASRSHVGNLQTWQGTAPDDDTAWKAHLHGAEAWDWLIHQGLIALRSDESSVNGWGYVTERGHKAARDPRGLDRARAEARIGVELHPLLEQKIRPQFLLGEHELAVLAAMREVEIRVRKLGGYGDEEYGVKMIRKAFDKDDGRLTDSGQVAAEQEATSHFFAGARPTRTR
jgi:Protein of unknown function (Hypoth_ymh)